MWLAWISVDYTWCPLFILLVLICHSVQWEIIQVILRRHILLMALATLHFFKAESWQEFTDYSQTDAEIYFCLRGLLIVYTVPAFKELSLQRRLRQTFQRKSLTRTKDCPQALCSGCHSLSLLQHVTSPLPCLGFLLSPSTCFSHHSHIWISSLVLALDL